MIKITLVSILLSVSACQTLSNKKNDDPSKIRTLQNNTYFTANFPYGTKTLALTFDDGPHSSHTEKVLNILDEFGGIKATFFMTGTEAQKYPHLVAEIHKRGHLLASHAYNHQYINQKSPEDMIKELVDLDAIIAPYNPPLYFFRAPYGGWEINGQSCVAAVLNANESTRKYIGPISWDIGGAVQWNGGTLINAADWACPGHGLGVEACAQGYLNASGNGGIVLMHDVQAITPALLRTYLSSLQAIGGFKFIRLDEIPGVAAFQDMPAVNRCSYLPGPTDPQPVVGHPVCNSPVIVRKDLVTCMNSQKTTYCDGPECAPAACLNGEEIPCNQGCTVGGYRQNDICQN